MPDDPTLALPPAPSTGSDADGEDDLDVVDVRRLRGFAGWGPTALVAVKPPRYVRRKLERQRGEWWVLWRAVTGDWLDGRDRTNATWGQFATKSFAWSERSPRRWSALPRLDRMAARWAGAVAAAGVGWAYTEAPDVVVAAAWGTGWAGLVTAGWVGVESALDWPHRRRWVKPLHTALAPRLGYPERLNPRRYLRVPRDFAREGGGAILVALPPTFTGGRDDEEGRKIAAVVRTELGLSDTTESWKLSGRSHYVVIRRPRREHVPARVLASDPAVLELIEAQPPSRPLIGLTYGGRPVWVDLDTEAPHVLPSMATGAGKSKLLQNLACQLMHHGAQVVVLDIKYTSQSWLVGLADYARDLEVIHRKLVWLDREADRRNQAAQREDAPQFRRLVVLVEEGNITLKLLGLWWQINRRHIPDDQAHLYGDPAQSKSPAEMALYKLACMGRERNMNLFWVAQLATANALGGPEMREQFSCRILGRATQKAWAMLAPEIQPAPVCSQQQGRVHVVQGGAQAETQGTLWTPADSRSWAIAGQWDHAGDVPAVPASQAPVLQGAPVGHVPPLVPVAPPAPAGPSERLVTLGQASADHGHAVVGVSRAALRKASTRDPDFPRPVVEAETDGDAHRYRPDDLRLWEANRPSRRNKQPTPAP